MRSAAVGVAAAALLTACSTGTPSVATAPTTVPPRPPAACTLDTTALAAATGVQWAADASTASDTRCVYDPATGPAHGSRFLTVTLAPAVPLDDVAQLCDKGSRTAAASGFVCRFQQRSVFGAVVRGEQVMMISASGAPEGVTVDALVAALAGQL